ncbi:MAG TPA: 5'-nucleotidase, lipoprotein e(P4) family [Flavisolibacter sp.]|nr:5'-nucleotidase, lipoprotein e(P4) family [Flavisolibacter sp.]
MMRYILFLLIPFLGCRAPKQAASSLPVSSLVTNGKLFATYFQQQAGEYRALCFQAYNLARLRVDQASAQPASKPMAIITDLDETVLDNSVYDAAQTLQGKDYEPASWLEWTARGEADTVPGAPSFLRYAASKGMTIFYLTNREEKERSGTLLNLRRLDLPYADNDHLVMRQQVSSKEERRQDIMKNFEVVLLIGDNLADFDRLFDKKSVAERNANVEVLRNQFGQRFILLPNPVYGDWEAALYQYRPGLSLQQKDSIIRSALKSR